MKTGFNSSSFEEVKEVIVLPKCPSVNHLYALSFRGGYPRKFITAKGQAWFEEAGLLLRSQYKKQHPVTDKIELVLKLYYCGRFDWDNASKATSDLLEKTGVLVNDDQIIEAHIKKIRVEHRNQEKIEIKISILS